MVGLPAGPLVTINFVRQNLAGGKKISVAMLIDRPLLEMAAKRTAAEEFLANYVEAPEEIALPAANTGEGSASQQRLGMRTKSFEGKSLDEHLLEFYEKKPPGAVAAQKVRRKLEVSLQEYRDKFRPRDEADKNE